MRNTEGEFDVSHVTGQEEGDHGWDEMGGLGVGEIQE